MVFPHMTYKIYFFYYINDKCINFIFFSPQISKTFCSSYAALSSTKQKEWHGIDISGKLTWKEYILYLH